MICGRVMLAGAVLAGIVGAAHLVERHIRTAPAFAIRELVVVGRERLSESEVLAAAGLAVGRNVFELAPEEAESRLAGHPWIANARVERRLPGAFRIEVREHRAAAVLSLGELYLVADDGAVFKRLGDDDPVDLPVITGIERDRFLRDRTYRTGSLVEAVALLHDYRGSGLARRAPIAEVHVEGDGGLALMVGRDGMLVRLGRGAYREKLRRLRRVVDKLEQDRAQAAYVYLDNVRRPDRVTVRLR